MTAIWVHGVGRGAAEDRCRQVFERHRSTGETLGLEPTDYANIQDYVAKILDLHGRFLTQASVLVGQGPDKDPS